jgi:cell division protein FtsQ
LQSVINGSYTESYGWFGVSNSKAQKSQTRAERRRAVADRTLVNSGARRSNHSLYAWLEANSETAARLGLVACVTFYALTAAYGMSVAGHWGSVRRAVLAAANDAALTAGFGVSAVQIEGRRNIGDSEIAAALGPYDGVSIFAFDTNAARERLKHNGWISEARVMRLLPSTLVVEIEERKPYALWREGGKTAVIDEEGTLLSLAADSEFGSLPKVSGPGAAAPAKTLIDALAAYPDVKARVGDMERVAGRRWDLVMDTGLRVKLPAIGFKEAIGEFSAVAVKNPAALNEMAEMDFRLPSQFTVRLKDGSETGRKKFLSWLSGTEDSRKRGL